MTLVKNKGGVGWLSPRKLLDKTKEGKSPEPFRKRVESIVY